MQFDIIILVFLFIVWSIVREVIHYRQITKLEELLKSVDIHDFYSARKMVTPLKNHNQVMDEPNPIAFNDPEFDIKNIEKVIIDGKMTPVSIK